MHLIDRLADEELLLLFCIEAENINEMREICGKLRELSNRPPPSTVAESDQLRADWKSLGQKCHNHSGRHIHEAS